MAAPDERRSESWIAWITLLLAALAWSCAIIACLIAFLRGYDTLELELPLILAAPVYGGLGVVSYFALKRLGYHSRRNKVGAWIAGAFLTCFALVFPLAVRARTDISRVHCLSNLKQLGYACEMYAKGNQQGFPPSLVALYDDHGRYDMALVCCEAARHFKQRRDSPDLRIGDEHLTYYCYVRGLKPSDTGDYILAFDEEWNHRGEGVNVLHVDGYVRWIADVSRMGEDLARQMKELRGKGCDVEIIRPSWSRYPDRPVHTWPPWYIGWAGAFACVAAGFLIPVAGMILWEQWRRWRLARRE